MRGDKVELSATMQAEVLHDLIGDISASVFVSPHLDDAVLSCGALMSALS